MAPFFWLNKIKTLEISRVWFGYFSTVSILTASQTSTTGRTNKYKRQQRLIKAVLGSEAGMAMEKTTEINMAEDIIHMMAEGRAKGFLRPRIMNTLLTAYNVSQI